MISRHTEAHDIKINIWLVGFDVEILVWSITCLIYMFICVEKNIYHYRPKFEYRRYKKSSLYNYLLNSRVHIPLLINKFLLIVRKFTYFQMNVISFYFKQSKCLDDRLRKNQLQTYKFSFLNCSKGTLQLV